LTKPNHVIRTYNMNNAKYTVISRCLSLAKAALEGRWTFHNSTEALFWFRSVLKVDPENATARLGSARVYQYVASQPWWHNNVSLAKSAASKALAMLDEPVRTESVTESREKALVCGQIYSAIGQTNVARKFLNEGISIDPGYSTGLYFLHLSRLPRPRAVNGG